MRLYFSAGEVGRGKKTGRAHCSATLTKIGSMRYTVSKYKMEGNRGRRLALTLGFACAHHNTYKFYLKRKCSVPSSMLRCLVLLSCHAPGALQSHMC